MGARRRPSVAAFATPAEAEVYLRRLKGIGIFSAGALPGLRLRGYQVRPAEAIVESVEDGLGRQFAVVFSRQAGKDELLAQVIVYLLVRHWKAGGNVVVAAPTFRPQAALSRDRLLDRLARIVPPRWIEASGGSGTRDGYVVRVGRATARFLSAAPGANARGQTADLLLVANEAQDIRPAVWDAVFDPMAASTNATTLFLGTVWSRETLLARQMRFLAEREHADGIVRVWKVAWEEVARELPAYGERVRARMAQLGPDHPFVRTEYCLEELEGDGGLFPPHRLAQMQGDHPRRHRAEAGKRYALLVDVAGEEEGAPLSGAGPLAIEGDARRDSTALTVVEVEESRSRAVEENDAGDACVAPTSRLPTYRVVDRRVWTGVRHSALHGQLVDLAREVWRASAVVVDATGIGAGLTSFLAAELGTRPGRRGRPAIPVIPFVFTAASKSTLGWEFLGLIDAGRFKEYADDGDALTALYWSQLRATAYEAPSGPNRPLRWGVPAGRGPGHDDLVLSAALVVALDGLDWRSRVAVGTSPES